MERLLSAILLLSTAIDTHANFQYVAQARVTDSDIVKLNEVPAPAASVAPELVVSPAALQVSSWSFTLADAVLIAYASTDDRDVALQQITQVWQDALAPQVTDVQVVLVDDRPDLSNPTNIIDGMASIVTYAVLGNTPTPVATWSAKENFRKLIAATRIPVIPVNLTLASESFALLESLGLDYKTLGERDSLLQQVKVIWQQLLASRAVHVAMTLYNDASTLNDTADHHYVTYLITGESGSKIVPSELEQEFRQRLMQSRLVGHGVWGISVSGGAALSAESTTAATTPERTVATTTVYVLPKEPFGVIDSVLLPFVNASQVDQLLQQIKEYWIVVLGPRFVTRDIRFINSTLVNVNISGKITLVFDIWYEISGLTDTKVDVETVRGEFHHAIQQLLTLDDSVPIAVLKTIEIVPDTTTSLPATTRPSTVPSTQLPVTDAPSTILAPSTTLAPKPIVTTPVSVAPVVTSSTTLLSLVPVEISTLRTVEATVTSESADIDDLSVIAAKNLIISALGGKDVTKVHSSVFYENIFMGLPAGTDLNLAMEAVRQLWIQAIGNDTIDLQISVYRNTSSPVAAGLFEANLDYVVLAVTKNPVLDVVAVKNRFRGLLAQLKDQGGVLSFVFRSSQLNNNVILDSVSVVSSEIIDTDALVAAIRNIWVDLLGTDAVGVEVAIYRDAPRAGHKNIDIHRFFYVIFVQTRKADLDVDLLRKQAAERIEKVIIPGITILPNPEDPGSASNPSDAEEPNKHVAVDGLEVSGPLLGFAVHDLIALNYTTEEEKLKSLDLVRDLWKTVLGPDAMDVRLIVSNVTSIGQSSAFHEVWYTVFVITKSTNYDQEDVKQKFHDAARVVPGWYVDSEPLAASEIVAVNSVASAASSTTTAGFLSTSAPIPVSAVPTVAQTLAPTVGPVAALIAVLTVAPTVAPTIAPTQPSTVAPTQPPTATPTQAATVAPTQPSTIALATAPTVEPTQAPTTQPPTVAPTVAPTIAPKPTSTVAPTPVPTAAPTQAPTQAPTVAPTQSPTIVPTQPPTVAPTTAPTIAPTVAPTIAPIQPATVAPAQASEATTVAPTQPPTFAPTQPPTTAPAQASTVAPVVIQTPVSTVAATANSASTLAPREGPTSAPVPLSLTALPFATNSVAKQDSSTSSSAALSERAGELPVVQSHLIYDNVLLNYTSDQEREDAIKILTQMWIEFLDVSGASALDVQVRPYSDVKDDATGLHKITYILIVISHQPKWELEGIRRVFHDNVLVLSKSPLVVPVSDLGPVQKPDSSKLIVIPKSVSVSYNSKSELGSTLQSIQSIWQKVLGSRATSVELNVYQDTVNQDAQSLNGQAIHEILYMVIIQSNQMDLNATALRDEFEKNLANTGVTLSERTAPIPVATDAPVIMVGPSMTQPARPFGLIIPDHIWLVYKNETERNEYLDAMKAVWEQVLEGLNATKVALSFDYESSDNTSSDRADSHEVFYTVTAETRNSNLNINQAKYNFRKLLPTGNFMFGFDPDEDLQLAAILQDAATTQASVSNDDIRNFTADGWEQVKPSNAPPPAMDDLAKTTVTDTALLQYSDDTERDAELEAIKAVWCKIFALPILEVQIQIIKDTLRSTDASFLPGSIHDVVYAVTSPVNMSDDKYLEKWLNYEHQLAQLPFVVNASQLVSPVNDMKVFAIEIPAESSFHNSSLVTMVLQRLSSNQSSWASLQNVSEPLGQQLASNTTVIVEQPLFNFITTEGVIENSAPSLVNGTFMLEYSNASERDVLVKRTVDAWNKQFGFNQSVVNLTITSLDSDKNSSFHKEQYLIWSPLAVNLGVIQTKFEKNLQSSLNITVLHDAPLAPENILQRTGDLFAILKGTSTVSAVESTITTTTVPSTRTTFVRRFLNS